VTLIKCNNNHQVWYFKYEVVRTALFSLISRLLKIKIKYYGEFGVLNINQNLFLTHPNLSTPVKKKKNIKLTKNTDVVSMVIIGIAES